MTQYYVVIILTMIHWCISFFTDRIIFVTVNTENWNTYCWSKVLFLILLYLFYYFVVKAISTWKDKSDISTVFKYFLMNLVILLLAAIWTWPMNITTGDIQFLTGCCAQSPAFVVFTLFYNVILYPRIYAVPINCRRCSTGDFSTSVYKWLFDFSY